MTYLWIHPPKKEGEVRCDACGELLQESDGDGSGGKIVHNFYYCHDLIVCSRKCYKILMIKQGLGVDSSEVR
jgi:formylmethanofuran dehydrogenase subunit E